MLHLCNMGVYTKSDHLVEYGSSITCQLGTYKIIYKNKSKQFLLISDHPRSRDNSYKFNMERIRNLTWGILKITKK